MALPSTTAEAIREVLQAEGFSQSDTIEDFDANDSGALHKEFFLRGPRLVDAEDVSGESHQKWEMEIQFAFAPATMGDVDQGRFDLADEVATLHQALATDTTIQNDEFAVLSSDPEWNPDADVWEVLLMVSWSTYQAAV